MPTTEVHVSSSKFYETLSDDFDDIETSIDPSSSLYKSSASITNSLSTSENWNKLHVDITSSFKVTDMSMSDLANSLTSSFENWNIMKTSLHPSSFRTSKSEDTLISSEWVYYNDFDTNTISASPHLYSASDITNELKTVLVSSSLKMSIDATKTTSDSSIFFENWENMDSTAKSLSSTFNLNQIDTTKISSSENWNNVETAFKLSSTEGNWNKLTYDHSEASTLENWNTMHATVNPSSAVIAFSSPESWNEMSTTVPLYTTDTSNNEASSLFDSNYVAAMSSDTSVTPSESNDLSTLKGTGSNSVTQASDIKTTQSFYWHEASSTDTSLMTSTDNNYGIYIFICELYEFTHTKNKSKDATKIHFVNEYSNQI